MTSARRTVSRGALLVALMAGSGALTGGAAYADVLGGTGPLPLPAPLPTVPVLNEPAPSPSPSPSASPTATAAPAPAEQPAPEPAQNEPPAATDTGSTTSSSSESATASDAAPATEEVTASNASAPVVAPAPAPRPAAPVSTTARPSTSVPVRVAVPAAPVAVAPAHAPTAAAPVAGTPHAAARLDLADGLRTDALGSFSGFPQLTAGSLQLPTLPALPGLRPMIAPQGSSPLVSLLAGGADGSRAGRPVVRTGNSTPMQPAGGPGIVLFVMASAAGAAALARVSMFRRRFVHR